MVKNLDNIKIFNKYVKHYSDLGADYIGLHRQSFSNIAKLEQVIKKIILLKKKNQVYSLRLMKNLTIN